MTATLTAPAPARRHTPAPRAHVSQNRRTSPAVRSGNPAIIAATITHHHATPSAHRATQLAEIAALLTTRGQHAIVTDHVHTIAPDITGSYPVVRVLP